MLTRRLDLLVKVERLATSLDVAADVGYTCETSKYFYLSSVLAKWEMFVATVQPRVEAGDAPPSLVADHFPFADFFADAPPPLFRARDASEDYATAASCFRHIEHLFAELDECRAFELLRSSYDRGNFLLSKHAKVIAMTCTSMVKVAVLAGPWLASTGSSDCISRRGAALRTREEAQRL